MPRPPMKKLHRRVNRSEPKKNKGIAPRKNLEKDLYSQGVHTGKIISKVNNGVIKRVSRYKGRPESIYE